MASIIVLDDVSDAGVLVKRILERQGHQVTAFTEEEEAIRHAAKGATDLAILDIKLKRMTGVEVLAEMKKFAPGIKVIMLTGYPTLETARESLKLGASEYCVKPIDKEELESKVADVLRQDIADLQDEVP
ncbi:Response regulator receiver domain-containing protein [Desulfomicrobium apsheronum]|uniref:Response regulator receiver domain-containing protein n=1 Tax=Desulfomicrobium apsheronum TaxID=52560 RepID=A0A1I3TEI2_9BACT|nr:response regulator [Desulfomicrobium apsheronum]MDY0226748.1 response regulator [Desulfomicrobium apsheronum]SFJ68066.1 Response regulator receiver domain-containing protein [Desulfomicrobium apsheronum]